MNLPCVKDQTADYSISVSGRSRYRLGLATPARETFGDEALAGKRAFQFSGKGWFESTVPNHLPCGS